MEASFPWGPVVDHNLKHYIYYEHKPKEETKNVIRNKMKRGECRDDENSRTFTSDKVDLNCIETNDKTIK